MSVAISALNSVRLMLGSSSPLAGHDRAAGAQVNVTVQANLKSLGAESCGVTGSEHREYNAEREWQRDDFNRQSRRHDFTGLARLSYYRDERWWGGLDLRNYARNGTLREKSLSSPTWI